MNVSAFCHTLKTLGERRFCVLEGHREWQMQQAQHLVGGCTQTVWLTSEHLTHQQLATHARQMLGQECAHVVYDFACGVHPDVLGLISGVIKGGGLFIFLAPPTSIWSDSTDIDLYRYISQASELSLCGSFFLDRLQRILKEDPSVIWLSEKTQKSAFRTSNTQTPSWHMQQDSQGCVTPDQHTAVDAILKCQKKRGKSYLLMTANRGRGKSSAMGLAAQHLKASLPSIKLAISAPRQKNTHAFFQLAPQDTLFIAPDALVLSQHDIDLLFIDEAAAIPAPMLRAILKKYPKIIFASTEQGYEGSGKGFNLQFKKFLQQSTAKLSSIHIHTPIRWAETDPLEPLFAHILALESTLETLSPTCFKQANIICREIPTREYAQDEQKLHAIYSLLSCAHYQTKPSDLRALLDKPNQWVIIAEIDTKIVGVLWLQGEGELPASLRDKIWGGYTRLRGHLLPQSLSSHLGFADAIHMRFARVMRIVVHPDLHRHGIGSALLSAAESLCKNHQCQFMGAMYAADIDVTHFWLKNKFAPVRLGIKADTSSGQRSLMLLKSLEPKHESHLTQWQQAFQRQLLDLCPSAFKEVSPYLIQQLLPDAFANSSCTEDDIRAIYGFIHQHRGFEYTRPALRRWLLSDCQQWIAKSPELTSVLIALCLQYKSLTTICENNAQWAGTKALLKWLKTELVQFNP